MELMLDAGGIAAFSLFPGNFLFTSPPSDQEGNLITPEYFQLFYCPKYIYYSPEYTCNNLGGREIGLLAGNALIIAPLVELLL